MEKKTRLERNIKKVVKRIDDLIPPLANITVSVKDNTIELTNWYDDKYPASSFANFAEFLKEEYKCIKKTFVTSVTSYKAILTIIL